MDGRDYPLLIAFLAVARTRSFRAAATQLGLSPSVISKAVRALEERLGIRLLDRTTRSVAPTAAGLELIRRLEPALAEVDDALTGARAASGRPGGRVLLNLPRLAFQLAIEPRLAAFGQLYPDVHLNIVIDDALHDIVEAGFDAGIRVGDKVARDMIAVRLTPEVKPVVAASPAYLAVRSAPSTPEDLLGHACLTYRWHETGAAHRWRFTRGADEVSLPVSGPFQANDSDALVAAALAGLGLIYLPRERLHPLLADGRLIEVLPGSCATVPGFFLYYAHRRLERPALRAVIEHFGLARSRS